MKTKKHNIVQLGELLESPPRNGYSPVCPHLPTGKWVLGLSALDGQGLDISGVKPAPENEPLIDKFMLSPGDFLISRSNTFDTVGRVGVFRGEIENCSYPDLMMRFRPDCKKVNPCYLETYLRSDAAIKFIRQHATGTSGSMKKINQSTVESIPIALPPLREQEKIGQVLGCWIAAIEKTERLIDAKELRLRALYQRLFGQSSNSRSGWRIYQLSDLLTPRAERAIPTESLPLYSLTIEKGVTPKTERYDREFLVKDADAKEYSVVRPGDIVFNPANLRWGAIARAKIDKPVVVSPIYEVLEVCEEIINASLLEHALTSPRQIAYFATKTEGTLIERMAVKLDVFLHAKIYFPDNRKEQDKIATLLDDVASEIALHKSMLNSFELQKRGLMQKLLTGEWRVPVVEREAEVA